MYRNRFNISGQTLIVSLAATTLLYLLFSIVQPVGLALGAALLQSVTSATVPPYLNYQGVLRDVEGKPMSGLQKMTFRLYSGAAAPLNEARWTEEHTDVTVRDGQFSVLLGNNTPLPPELFNSPNLFIGVTVAPFDEMTPRQRLASVPYAMAADHAAALTAPNGSGTHAVHVDETGRVGVGSTTPQAQLQVDAATGTAFQVNAGGQQLVVNDIGLTLSAGNSKVGIGTAAPTVSLHIRGDEPNLMLDQNSASGAARDEVRFGIDGQRRAAVYYDKTTGDVGIENGSGQLKLHNYGLLETPGALEVKDIIHTTGLYVDSQIRMGPKSLKPVKIVRITHLGEDTGPVYPNVSASDYECTIGSWSTGIYDIAEATRQASKVWTYVQGGMWWVGVNFASDGEPDDTPSIDVVCFAKGMVEYDTTYGTREDLGN